MAMAPRPCRLRVVEEIVDRHRAVVRVLGVHVQVGEDERPVGEGLGRRTDDGAPAAEHGFGRDPPARPRAPRRSPPPHESLASAACVRRHSGSAASRPSAAPTSSGCSPDPARVDERHARGRRLGAEALHATLRGDEPGRAGQKARSALGVEGGAHGHAVAQRAGDVGPAGERARPHEDELPVRQPAERARAARARGSSSARHSKRKRFAGRASLKRSSSIPYGRAR